MIHIYKLKNRLNQLLLGVLVVFAFISCGEELNKPNLVTPNHRTVFTSEQFYGNEVQVGGEITLSDMSQGVEARKWSFPTGDVSVNASLSDPTLIATYNESGQHDVVLSHTFTGDAYSGGGTSPIGKTIDTTIVVTVLDSIKTEVTAFYVNDDADKTTGAALILENGAKNPIEAGEFVRLVSVSTGSPASYAWTAEGARPSEANAVTVDVKYSTLGVYDLSFIASRTRPFGSVPVSYTDYIEVIPSTKPLALDKVTAINQQLALVYSRDIDPATLNAADYSVTITPAASGPISPVVESVALDPTNPSNILLTLAGGEVVYDDDSATVSYTPGTVASVDGALAPAETNVALVHEYPNLLKEQGYDFGMEDTSVAWLTDKLFLKGADHTVAKSTAQTHSGDYSLRVEIDAASGGNSVSSVSSYNAIDETLHTFDLEAGIQYRFDAWVYIEKKGGSFNNNAKFFILDAAGNEDWAKFKHVYYSNAVPEGTWNQIHYNTAWPEAVWTSVGGEFQVIPHFINGNADTMIYYLDDMSIYPWNPRP